jgi:hypothetical protein
MMSGAADAGYCVVVESGEYETIHCPTPDDAQKAAERIIRERSTARGTTWCSIKGPSHSFIATVRMDAFGRVWTDVMPEGAVLL